MSAGIGLWKRTAIETGSKPRRRPSQSQFSPHFGGPLIAPMIAVARQVFLPGTSSERKHALLVAAEAETRISTLAEQLAIATSQLTLSRVAFIDASAPGFDLGKKKPRHADAESTLMYGTETSERVSRVPAEIFLFGSSEGNVDDWHLHELEKVQASFKYFVFATNLNDSATPVLCGLCEGAVLVLSANRTRRETALQAKATLQRFAVPLLGTVLTDRVFSIPDAVYRRL
jgi:hypothetical protein